MRSITCFNTIEWTVISILAIECQLLVRYFRIGTQNKWKWSAYFLDLNTSSGRKEIDLETSVLSKMTHPLPDRLYVEYIASICERYPQNSNYEYGFLSQWKSTLCWSARWVQTNHHVAIITFVLLLLSRDCNHMILCFMWLQYGVNQCNQAFFWNLSECGKTQWWWWLDVCFRLILQPTGLDTPKGMICFGSKPS